VAAVEHSEKVTADRPQTVSSGNGGPEWVTRWGGVIEGLAEGIQVVALN